jgi:hypothetical protein
MSERYRSGRETVISGEVTAWEAFNGVNGYVLHDSTRRQKSSFDRFLASQTDPSNKKAEQIVMALVS